MHTIHRSKVTSVLTMLLCLFCTLPTASQQRKDQTGPAVISEVEIPFQQQQALRLLLQLANELKGHDDKPAAALLLSKIADAIWKSDEQAARTIFSNAFDAANQPALDGLLDSQKPDFMRRQAGAMREVLQRLAVHDRKSVESLLEQIEQKKATAEDAPSASSTDRSEMLAWVALELVGSDPQQARRLGILSLSGSRVPTAFGRLLFALDSSDRTLSDTLYREALGAMRRNGYGYNVALLSLSNYMFNSQGVPHPKASPADARLFADFLVDAANAHVNILRGARQSGGVSEDGANVFRFLSSRAVPIVERNAPDRVQFMRASLDELYAGLNAQQRQQTDYLASLQRQQTTVSSGVGSDIDSQVRQAEQERDPKTRDLLFRNISLELMIEDEARARTVAAKIANADTRMQTEDDIYLYVFSRQLSDTSFEDARRTALKVNDYNLRARALAELAGRALSGSKDIARANELLSESYSVALKGDDIPDKLDALLFIAQLFSKFDSVRAFEVLSASVKTINQLKTEPPKQATLQSTLPVIKVITVVNGKEVMAGERATISSISFDPVAPLARQDFAQAVSTGERIQDKLLRARFLIAASGAVLNSVNKPTTPHVFSN